jgi:hypothetical protein
MIGKFADKEGSGKRIEGRPCDVRQEAVGFGFRLAAAYSKDFDLNS